MTRRWTVVSEGGGGPPVDTGRAGQVWGPVHFFGSGTFKDEWMELYANQQKSSETTAPLPYDMRLDAITFGNKKNNTKSKVRISKNTTSSSNYEYQWVFTGAKYAWQNDIWTQNIDFDAGDRIRVYAKDHGNEPDQMNILLTFRILNDISLTGLQKKSSGA